MSLTAFCLSDDVEETEGSARDSKRCFIRKAKGSRNLLAMPKDRPATSDNWDSLEDDERNYKRIYSRTNHSSSSDSRKKKEISWADRIIGSCKGAKHDRSEKMKEIDSSKSLVKANKEKKKDSMRHVTQTSVVYFSKSNSYDGRVIMASRKEGKERAKDKVKGRKHDRKHSRDAEAERQSCMDAALAAAAVRAVVGVTPNAHAPAAVPRAYRVKTSPSQSFVVEPLWCDSQQSVEESDGGALPRSLAAPEDTSCLDSASSVPRSGLELTFAQSNHSPPANPTSQHWVPQNAMVPVPAGQASTSRTQAFSLPDEGRLPCNVSVNIQLVASNSNLTARALLTDGSGISQEVPAKISWESNQNKTTALSILDSLTVAKTIEQALAKALMENANSFSRLSTTSNDMVTEKSTTTASLENSFKLPPVEKSTNTLMELFKVDFSKQESSVYETSQCNTILSNEHSTKNNSADPGTFPFDMLTKAQSADHSIPNDSPQKPENDSVPSEKDCLPETQSVKQRVAFLETDVRFKDPACCENVNKNEILSTFCSLVENTIVSREKALERESKSLQSEGEICPKSQNEWCNGERPLEFGEGMDSNTKANGTETKKQITIPTAGEMPSQEKANETQMTINFFDEASKRAAAEGWVAEVSRMVSEELRVRSKIEQKILLQERESIRRRIAMEERKSRRGRNAMKERAKLQERVAMEVRKVLAENSAPKNLSPVREKSSREDKVNEGVQEINDCKDNDKDVSKKSSTPVVNAPTDKRAESEKRDVADSEKRVVADSEETEDTSVADEEPYISEKDTASGDQAPTEERKPRRPRSRRRRSGSKQRKELVDRNVTEADMDASDWEKQSTKHEEPIQMAAPKPSPWSGEVVERVIQEPFVFGERSQAQGQRNGQSCFDRGTTEHEAGMVDAEPSQAVSQQRQTQQPMYVPNSRSFFLSRNTVQNSAPNKSQELSAMSNYQITTSNVNVPSHFSHNPPEGNFNAPQRTVLQSSTLASAVMTSGPTAHPNALTGTPYPPTYAAAPLGNAPGCPWGNAPISTLPQYAGLPPVQQQWMSPQTNPFVAGAWPCPSAVPYRFVVPYRHNPSNFSSSTSIYSTLRGSRGRVGYQSNAFSGASRMGGCMPLGYGAGSHLQPHFVPIPPAGATVGTTAGASVVATVGTTVGTTVGSTKAPHAALCEMLDPRLVRPNPTSISVRTLFAKGVEMDDRLAPDDSSGRAAELENSVADEFDDSFNCNSLSDNSFPPNTDNSFVTTESPSHDEKSVSQLECSLVDLLRKCSHALEQQADQLTTSIDDHHAALHHIQRRERRGMRRMECEASAPSVPAVTRAVRIRNADDPLELLRQTRVQEREISRNCIPGPKIAFRRNKISAECSKKFGEE